MSDGVILFIRSAGHTGTRSAWVAAVLEVVSAPQPPKFCSLLQLATRTQHPQLQLRQQQLVGCPQSSSMQSVQHPPRRVGKAGARKCDEGVIKQTSTLCRHRKPVCALYLCLNCFQVLAGGCGGKASIKLATCRYQLLSLTFRRQFLFGMWRDISCCAR